MGETVAAEFLWIPVPSKPYHSVAAAVQDFTGQTMYQFILNL